MAQSTVAPGTVIRERWKIGRKIESGSFGFVHLGTDVNTDHQVAVKFESLKSNSPQLMYEAKLAQLLQGGEGIAGVHWYGIEGNHTVMVMDLLGPSLEDLLHSCQPGLGLKSVLMLADQMITRVEFLHTKHFIHRDIKPDNFLLGVGDNADMLHIIDFGLSKRYRDPNTFQHIPFRDGKSLTGTARYCSIGTHMGFEQSRRDDLEAVGYILVYLARGKLPWQGLKAVSRKEKYDKIAESKATCPVEELCNGCPEEFSVYAEYCRRMSFDCRPDYAFLRRLFKDIFMRQGFRNDGIFDWSAGEAGNADEIEDDQASRMVEMASSTRSPARPRNP
eukprot:TRINITY_DN41413_c0_g1_i1.p1 TRINITY_DN41413_c0_g1~~TRINITY_DN41413_c0_g1_i1.p1  ORF type:complete len:333 (+),score=39.68 TRINITY_DN41413_c0_g1_i1:46-1044(+)